MFGVEVLDRHHCFIEAKNNNCVPVINRGLISILTAVFYSCAPGNPSKPSKSIDDFDGAILFQTVQFFAAKIGCFVNPNKLHPVMNIMVDINE